MVKCKSPAAIPAVLVELIIQLAHWRRRYADRRSPAQPTPTNSGGWADKRGLVTRLTALPAND